jgi:cold shock protein
MSGSTTGGKTGDRVTGVVKWFSDEKGYGFIVQDGGGPDVFVHFKAIRRDKGDTGFRTLVEDQRVEFTIGDGRNNRLAADDVVKLKVPV